MSDSDPTAVHRCPQPPKWDEVYRHLLDAHEALVREARETGNAPPPPPPTPLILGGWVFTSSEDKHCQWERTVEWARRHGESNVVEGLDDEDFAVWHVPASAWVPPGFGQPPEEPKPRPSDDAVDGALRSLRERWDSIAGPELAAVTYPYKFTGRKRRRLVVLANPNATPPWGSWGSARDAPSTFTAFRRAVNRAIAPLHVDHIAFKRSSLSPAFDALLRRR